MWSHLSRLRARLSRSRERDRRRSRERSRLRDLRAGGVRRGQRGRCVSGWACGTGVNGAVGSVVVPQLVLAAHTLSTVGGRGNKGGGGAQGPRRLSVNVVPCNTQHN